MKKGQSLAILLIISLNVNQLTAAPIIKVNEQNENDFSGFSDAILIQNRLLIEFNQLNKNKPKAFKVWITAYSSTPEETDETPFITASNSHVRLGVAASNFLPFGVRFRMPEIFGSKVFVVEDRMNERYQNHIDIWFADKKEAKNFGRRFSKIEIL